MKPIKTWYEVTSTLEDCKITGTVISPKRPIRASEGDKSFDYFPTREKAEAFVWGFYNP